MKNWDKILTLLIALYGAILSTYILLKPKSKCKLTFENGFIKLEEQKKLIAYCAIRLTNLSEFPIRIQSYGFENHKHEILHIPTISKSITNEICRAEIDFNDQSEVNMGEKIQLVDGEKFLQPFDTKYIFYEIAKLKNLTKTNDIYFFFNDYNKKRRIRIKKKMINV